MPPPPALKKKAGTKNPPIFSQEYLIQNHGKEGVRDRCKSSMVFSLFCFCSGKNIDNNSGYIILLCNQIDLTRNPTN
jgi:hypothetical protein